MNDNRPRRRDDTAPSDRSRSLRLFVSVELSDAWRHAAEAVADDLKSTLGQDYRWVRPELYHVTVVFLGDHPEDRVSDIEAAMRAAADGVPAFELELGSLSGFGVDVPRALILTVADPSGGLQTFRRRLDRELGERRIPYDRKPLSPHLTLGRARVQRGGGDRRQRSRGSAPILPSVPRPNVGTLGVTEVALIKSDLLADGPRYETLMRVTLAGS